MEHTTAPLAHWPADERVPLDTRSIGEVLLDWARTAPDSIAVQWEDADGSIRGLSYAALAADAVAFARRVLAQVPAGEPIAVAAAPGIDWVTLEYGAALAGTPLVPLNPAFTDSEMTHLFDTSGARLVFADDEHRGTPLLTRLSSLATQRAVQAHRLADWRDLPAIEDDLPPVDADQVFLVQYTSGTTGRPKGALLSHRAAYNSAAGMMARFGAQHDDNWLNTMPLHHVGGSVSVVISVLSVGATVTLLPGFDAGKALEMIPRTRVTIFSGVPTMHLAILEHPGFDTTDLSSIRVLMAGGSTLAPSLIRRVEDAFGASIANAFGQSESPNAIMTSLTDSDIDKSETIGTPLPHREVRIVGPDDNTLLVGEAGELWMRGPLVMEGYVGVDAATAARTLDADGWLHTGDLCSMDERGLIRIRGRLRDVIIRGGENIYPAEVEDVMLSHPAVAEMAVVGMPDDYWGEVPVGVLRLVPGAAATDAELEAHGRASLTGFKVPRRWERVDSFPLTASGKVKKFELQQQLSATGGR